MKRTNTIWFEGHNLQRTAEAQSFCLSRVAKECGVPVRKLRAFLKGSTGMRAKTWMLNVFANRVTTLQRRRIELGRIAAMLGFRDLGHFSRAFYTARGYPPSENLARLARGGMPVARVRHRPTRPIAARLAAIHDWEHVAELVHYNPSELAAYLHAQHGVTRKSWERYCSEHFGVSPRRFLDQFRNQRAQHLLKAGFKNKEVAAAVGYSQASSFGRNFKVSHGAGPKAWSKFLKLIQVHQPGIQPSAKHNSFLR